MRKIQKFFPLCVLGLSACGSFESKNVGSQDSSQLNLQVLSQKALVPKLSCGSVVVYDGKEKEISNDRSYHVDVQNHVVKVKIVDGVEKTEMLLERPNPTLFERIQQWIGERIYGEYVVYLKTDSGVTKEGVWVFYFPKKSTAKDGNKYDLKIMDYRFPAMESEMKNNRIAYASCSPRA